MNHPGTRMGRLAKFVTVGVAGVFVNVVVFTTLLTIGQHYVASGVVAWFAAATFNFGSNWIWTYERPGTIWEKYPKSLMVRTVGGVANIAVLMILIGAVGFPAVSSSLLAAIAGVSVNFAGAELWTFAMVVSDR